MRKTGITGLIVALAMTTAMTAARAEDGVTDTQITLGGSTALTGPGALVGNDT